jgi:hypothetical protein
VPKLKVAQVGAAFGKCMPDRRHLTGTVLEGDPNDGQFRTERSPKMTGLRQHRGQVIIRGCKRRKTGPQSFHGSHHLQAIDRQYVHPDGRIRCGDPSEISETARCKIHSSRYVTRSVEECGGNDLWQMTDPSDCCIVFDRTHSHRPGTEVCDDRLNGHDVRIVCSLRYNDPGSASKEAGSGGVGTGYFPAGHWMRADETAGSSGIENWRFD